MTFRPYLVRVPFAIFCSISCVLWCREAVFVKRVCELYSSYPTADDIKRGLIPAKISWSGPNAKACLRVSQGLFNEVCDVAVDNGGSFVQVRQLNLFHQDKLQAKKQCTFWCSRADIRYIDELDPEVVKTCIPEPVIYEPMELKNCYASASDVVWLKVPVERFSVGTRLVVKNKKLVWFNFEDGCLQSTVFDPDAVLFQKTYSDEEKRQLFISLLRSWIDWAAEQKKRIPYVWGGRNLREAYPDGDFEEKSLQFSKKVLFWQLPGKNKDEITPLDGVWSGFDCSGLVALAAQMSGIDGYFCKTTATIKALGKPLAMNELIKPGDLLYVPGHVMVLDGDLVIEASGYSSGWGGLHQIPIAKRFYGINDAKELYAALQSGKKLQCLSKSGKPYGKPVDAQIYSLIQRWSS